MAIIFLDFLIFYQFFLLLEMKGNAVIRNRHGIYELPQELPNNVRLKVTAKGI